MKKVLFLLLINLKISFAQTPEILWQNCYGGWGYESAEKISQVNDGGYIICGYSNSQNIPGNESKGGADYWVFKTDSFGKLQWQKLLGSGGEDYAKDIIQTSDGGYIIVGHISSGGKDVKKFIGKTDGWVVKLNSNGDIQWQKTFGGFDWDRILSINTTSDKGYIMAGWTGESSAWFIKTDSIGNLIWETTFKGWSQGQSIMQTSDGGYIASGIWQNLNMGPNGKTDYLLLRMDEKGNELWHQSNGSPWCDGNLSLGITKDGSYILSGYLSMPDPNPSDIWIIKLDSSGNEKWNKTYGGSGQEWAECIKQVSDGGYIIGAFSNSNDGNVSKSHGINDYWIVKLNELGDLQWEKSVGGSGHDAAISIIETRPNEYVVVGESGSNDGDVSGNNGLNDCWIIKLGQKNNTFSSLEKREEGRNFQISIFPNPFNSKLTIVSSEVKQSIEIMNALGSVILSSVIETEKTEIDLSKHPSGIYFVKIGSVSRKIIKE